MDRPHTNDHERTVECTTRIVTAYLSHNRIPPYSITPLIEAVFTTLKTAPDGRECAIRIVMTYLAHNSIPPNSVAPFIDTVFRALRIAPDECTARIAMAYLAHNWLPPNSVASLIETVFTALRTATGNLDATDISLKQTPARRLTAKEIADSINDRFLISFEDGKPYRVLTRHLHQFGLTPDAYRKKWDLPKNYPMTSEVTSKRRTELARQIQFGKDGIREHPPRNDYVMKIQMQARALNAATITAASTD